MAAPRYEGGWWVFTGIPELPSHHISLVAHGTALTNCGATAATTRLRPKLPPDQTCLACQAATL